MTSQAATYDSIGERFEDFTDTASQRSVETETFFHMVGAIQGKSVLDLACGFGYFGRELYHQGASKVVGVDISSSMIELARKESARNQEAIEYHVANVCDMGVLGHFDRVTAAWLFNYAQSPQELEKMFKVVARNMVPGGKLIAYTVDPGFELQRGNFTKYGVHVLSEEAHAGGFRHHAEFVTQPPSASPSTAGAATPTSTPSSRPASPSCSGRSQSSPSPIVPSIPSATGTISSATACKPG